MQVSVSAPIEIVDGTEAFYERQARAYHDATLRTDISPLYDRFLPRIPPGGKILDAGSGSGRDTLAFLQRGFLVDAFDASPALCALSSALTGIRTKILRFQDFQSPTRYDGIWACASLLHVPKPELPDAVRRLIAALKPGGAIYMSFKHGDRERVTDDGRYFLDLDEPSLRALLTGFPGIDLVDLWISAGEGDFGGRGKWLNVIAVKAEAT